MFLYLIWFAPKAVILALSFWLWLFGAAFHLVVTAVSDYLSVVTIMTTVTTTPATAVISLGDFRIYTGDFLNTPDSQFLIFPTTDDVLLTP